MGLITPEDLQQIVSGGVKEGSTQEDQMSVKVCLELINLLTNIHVVRKDATHSALRYLFTNCKDNDLNGDTGLKRKSTFDVTDANQECSVSKLSKISTTVVNKGFSKVDKTIAVDTTVDESYELDDFSITDTGVLSFDGDLMFS